jgi:hypothetical protein
MPTGTNHAMNPISSHVRVNYRFFGNVHLKDLFCCAAEIKSLKSHILDAQNISVWYLVQGKCLLVQSGETLIGQ